MRLHILVLLFFFITVDVNAQDGRQVAVLIGGLGGTPEYTEKFEQYLFDTRKGLIDNYGFDSGDIRVLAEASIVDRDFVDELSNSENIRSVFQQLASDLSEEDALLVFMFGHGSYDGSRSVLNIPRRDLADVDYAGLIDRINVGQLVFVNTASSSGPFVRALSGQDRVVITATRSGTEKNETSFPEYLSQGLLTGDADMDRNGRVSVLEMFNYAAESTARAYETAGLLASEHSLLEDTGDGSGFEYDDLSENGEGHIAATVYLGHGGRAIASAGSSGGDPGQRSDLERRIAELKSRKTEMNVDEYYDALEVLFVQLARLAEQ